MAIIEGHKCSKNANGKGAKFQEKTYGKGRRVANKGKEGYNCTVCGEVVRYHTRFTVVSGD
jgi:hypothetical protein